MKGLVGQSVSTKGTGPKTPLGKLLAAGMMVLQQPQVEEAIIDASMSENPEEGLSKIARGIVDALDEKSGGKVPPDAMSKFALELVEAMAALAMAVRDEDDDSLGPRTMKRMLEDAMQEGQQQPQQGQPPQGQPQQAPQQAPEQEVA